MFLFNFYINNIRIWKKLSSKLLLVLLALNFAGLFTIASLSSIISVIIMLLFSIFLNEVSMKNNRKIYLRMIFIFSIFIFLSHKSGLLSNVTNRLIENKQSEVRADYYEDVAGYGREVLVKNAYAFFLRNPLIGNGLNSFKSEYGKSTHNSYMWSLTSGGIIGFILWAAFNVNLIFNLRNEKKSFTKKRNAINNFLKSICIGGMIYAFAHTIHLNKFYWLIIAISIANVSRKNMYS